jgi:hypothetical protein
VVFCMVTIVIVYFKPSPEIDRTISDWSFAALLGVVGITRRAALMNPRSAEQHDDIGAQRHRRRVVDKNGNDADPAAAARKPVS